MVISFCSTVFPNDKKIVDAPSFMPKDVEMIRPYYTYNKQILHF